jgi:predicted exporter
MNIDIGRDYSAQKRQEARERARKKASQGRSSRVRFTPAELERQARERRLRAAQKARLLKAAREEGVKREREAFKEALKTCWENATPWQRGYHSEGSQWVPNWTPGIEDLRRAGYPF